jgi:hypothetical protein
MELNKASGSVQVKKYRKQVQKVSGNDYADA